MSTKKPSNFRSLSLKISILIFLLSLKGTSQSNTITRIHTDWNRNGTGTGYWTSNSATGANNRPTTENNLLAFEWRGKTFSTGVDDAKLTTNNVVYDPNRFRALKIQTLAYNTDTFFLQGSMIDGSAGGTTLNPAMAGTSASGAELASRLTDGANGLSLGTGVANIAPGTAEFKIGTNNLNLTGINDDIPDILVTQVAAPGGADIFKFVNAAGATVGNEISVNFGSVSVIGTYSLDLFRASNGAAAFVPADTRDIRMLGFDTSAFGINSTNASQVDRFVVVFSGSSDCAFIAVNTKSLKIAELSMIKKATLSSCGKAGDIINYSFDIRNTGEVPITNISVSDPMAGIVFSNNSIPSLEVGATATINATYTVTAADVTAGRIVNSATVTGTDPSLNTVTDISGTDYNNNIPTTTILLASPTIGTVHNFTCAGLGSIDLSGLPSSGTWQISQTGTAPATYNGTGSTFNVPNLAVGSYSFRVSIGGCNSPATTSVSVGNDSSTTWNGSSWSAGPPGLTRRAIINSASTQPFTADITICALTINVPTGTGDPNVIIPEGVTLTVINEVVSNGKLVFEDTSSLIQTTNAVNTGEIVYKRKALVARYDLTYWGMPVKKDGFLMHDFSPNTLIDKYFTLDPATSSWTEIYNGQLPMIAGNGYSIRAPQSYDANTKTPFFGRFTGVPINGDLSVSVTEGRWNLIGNPYPSAIYAPAFIGDNPNIGALYLWAHVNLPQKGADGFYYYDDDFVVTTGLGSNSTDGVNYFNGYIGAAQGFIVKAPASTIHFNNNQRQNTTNTQFYKTAQFNGERNRVWLNFTNTTGTFKQILLGYATGATNAIDVDFDATSMNSNPLIDFYSVGSAKKLTIQGRALPFEKSDVVPLGYMLATKGDYTISIDHADGLFDEGQDVYLEDKTLEKMTNLRLENYRFTTAAGTFNNRFAIRYTNKTLGVDDVDPILDGIMVSVKNKVITISSSKEIINDVVVYNILGQEIFNKKKVNNTDLEIRNLQTSDQILIVKTTLQNGSVSTEKIIIH